MCNIAGYVGDRQAAPILIEMMRRQEGLDGGYYTGIATIHEGRIHHIKLAGDLQYLLDHTDAIHLPGNIGIIHSRTQAGGGDEWAHPFIGNSLGRPATAYVANGSAGCFADRQATYNPVADSLFSEGYEMFRREGDFFYNRLSDGSVVHMSDLLCQNITRHIDEGIAPAVAMGMGYCEMPAEIVGLMLATKTPDQIIWSRLNMPMNLAWAPHGAYLASAPMAFPEDAGEPIALPACCSGAVGRDSMSALKFKNPPAQVPAIDGAMRRDAFLLVEELLKCEPLGFPELCQAVQDRFFKDQPCAPAALLTYEMLYAFQKAERLQKETRLNQGAWGELTAPKFFFSLK